MLALLPARLATTMARAVRGNARHDGLLADANGGDVAARLQIEHGDIVAASIGDVAAKAAAIHRNGVRIAMDGERGDDRIFLSVYDADGAAAAVDDVDFVFHGIGGQACRAAADLHDSIQTQVDEVENGDGIVELLQM